MGNLNKLIQDLENGKLKFNMDFINDECKMESIGFKEVDDYWTYFSKADYNDLEFSFYAKIFKENTLRDSSICFLDDDWAMPYDYEKVQNESSDLYKFLDNKVLEFREKFIKEGLFIEGSNVESFVKNAVLDMEYEKKSQKDIVENNNIFTIKPKFEYKCFKFILEHDYDNIEDLINFFETEGKLKVLDYDLERDEWDKSEYYTIYYLDVCGEPKRFEVKNDYYVWFDETGLVNSCIKSYLLENYEISK